MKKIPGVSLSNCIFSTSDSSSRTCGIYPTNSLHAKKPWRVAKREQAIHVFPSSIQGGAEDVSGGHGWSWGDHRAVNSRPGAAVPPREDHSLPEAGLAGAAERQSCREMKSELAQLGLQGRISVPINNSGIPWGREDDIISHPFPITTLPLPSLFPIIPLHPKSWGHLGTMLCHPPPKIMSPRNWIPNPCLPEVWSASATQGRRRNPRNNFLPPVFPWRVWSFHGFTESVRAVWCHLFLGRAVGKK